MIITIVADVFGTPNNGTTIAAMHLISALSKHGHSVRVICPDSDKKDKDGYYIVPTMNFGPFQPIVDHNGVVLAKADPMTIGRALYGSDEVHIMMPFLVGRATVKMANHMGIPVSAGFHVQAENVTAHFFNFIKNKEMNHWVYLDFWHHFYRYVDAIHYPTQFIRDVFEANIRQKTNGYVISNGVNSDFKHLDIPRSPICQNKFVILCTGRYSKEKRQSLLIDAVALSKHKDEIQIVFAGEGPRLSELKKRAAKKGVAPEYRFFTRAELVKMINMSDLYVHTSEVEIEAISCLEALSCGIVPVINDSPKSATREFALSEKNLFALNDPKDLAGKIDYWFEHPEEKKACAAAYEKYCDQFDFDLCMEKMVKMIEETAAIKKTPVQDK